MNPVGRRKKPRTWSGEGSRGPGGSGTRLMLCHCLRVPARELPHVDPHARRGFVYRAYARLVGTRAMGWVSRRFGWKLDPFLLRLSGGRLGFGLLLPTALLETRGARTGRPRSTAVIYCHDGERVTIGASKLGLPEHPAWFHNLRADPDVAFGGRPFRAEIVDDERERA